MPDARGDSPAKSLHFVGRVLILAGICLILLGGCCAGTAEGFGDAPPPLDQSRRQKTIGIWIMLSGGAIAMVSAISLYLSDNQQQQDPGPTAYSES